MSEKEITERIMEDDEIHKKGGEVSPALISIHPLEESIAVAIGSELRVFDLVGTKPVVLHDHAGGPSHSDSIRSICFGAKGTLFASAGDDKLVKIWKVDSWKCIRTVSSEKRVTAVSISHDGLFVCLADKFGVVWVVDLNSQGENQCPVDKSASPLLGHYCSIITSLEFSPDGRFIVSADRDFKIRITVFPKKPLKGAHEIQSFCLGHTDFVSCLAFAFSTDDSSQGFLLSGGGDSTVRLWDYLSGSLLDTCDIGSKLACNGDKSKVKEDGCSVVTDLCVCHNGSLVSVSVQSFHGVILLNCNLIAKTLSFSMAIPIVGNFIPTSMATGNNSDHLWMVMGASGLPSADPNVMYPVRVKVIAGLKKFHSDIEVQNLSILKDDDIPGSKDSLMVLQGSLDVEKDEDSLVHTAEALKTAMRNLLIKRQYSVEKREVRKKSRNDRKLKRKVV